ncbi:MAG TPA: TIGR02266 family protein [Polyangiaceae bacterium]|nr:TIGR02266 family protein [Polyangiaceae bacterium]
MSAVLKAKIRLFKELDDKRAQEGLTEDEQAQWMECKEAIERFLAEGDDLPPSSRRSSLRVPSQMAISFESAGDFYKAYLRNISEGGVYIATQEDLRMGDRFLLTVTVGDGYEQVTLNVEVVWVNKQPSPGSGLDPGVGVAWLDLTPDKKALIKRVVHRALDEVGEAGD